MYLTVKEGEVKNFFHCIFLICASAAMAALTVALIKLTIDWL